jgi:hypothetical protein
MGILLSQSIDLYKNREKLIQQGLLTLAHSKNNPEKTSSTSPLAQMPNYKLALALGKSSAKQKDAARLYELKFKLLELAEKEAVDFLQLIYLPIDVMDLTDTPSLSPLAVLYLIAEMKKGKAQEITKKIAAARSEFSKKGAAAKRLVDPKQTKKIEVRGFWEAWQKTPKLYKNKSAFSLVMLDKFESLENAATIQRWCREWGKTNI